MYIPSTLSRLSTDPLLLLVHADYWMSPKGQNKGDIIRYRTLSIQARPKAYFFEAYPKVKNPKVGSFFRAPEEFEGLRSKKEKIIKTPSFFEQKIKWGEILYDKN